MNHQSVRYFLDLQFLSSSLYHEICASLCTLTVVNIHSPVFSPVVEVVVPSCSQGSQMKPMNHAHYRGTVVNRVFGILVEVLTDWQTTTLHTLDTSNQRKVSEMQFKRILLNIVYEYIKISPLTHCMLAQTFAVFSVVDAIKNFFHGFILTWIIHSYAEKWRHL
jgi:hypothetical protein